MKKFGMTSFKFLYSVKFALILISLIITTLVVTSFIEQGQSMEFYTLKFPKIGNLLYKFGFTNYTRSILFYIITVLFFINLSLCSIRRIYREITGKIKIKIGPDLIHIGLIIIFVGGLLNITGEQRGTILLNKGESINIGSYSLKLNDFKILKYPSGEPKDWISSITIEGPKGIIKEDINIEVNKPLRFKGFSIFQNSYNITNSVYLKSTIDSREIEFKSGWEYKHLSNSYELVNVIPGTSGTFKVENDKGISKNVVIYLKEHIGDYILLDSREVISSGLMVKKEPGYLFIFVGLISMFLGFITTYIQKLWRKKL